MGGRMSLDHKIEQEDALEHCEVLYQDKKNLDSIRILRKIFFPSYYHLYSQLRKKFRL